MTAQSRADVVVAGHRRDENTARQATTSDDPAIRQSAYNALARTKALTPGDLAAAATDTHPAVRRRAATLAGCYPDIAVDMMGLLCDVDASVVEVAAWAAGERAPEADVIGVLIERTSDHEDPLVRESAVAALGALGAEEALPAIIAACSDKPAIRRRAVLALAPFSGPEVDATLQRALEDKDWQTRQAAEDLLA